MKGNLKKHNDVRLCHLLCSALTRICQKNMAMVNEIHDIP